MNEKYKQNAIKLAELTGGYCLDLGNQRILLGIYKRADALSGDLIYDELLLNGDQLIQHFTSYNELFKILRSMPDNWGYELGKNIISVFHIPISERHCVYERITDEENYIYELQNACIYYLEHQNG